MKRQNGNSFYQEAVINYLGNSCVYCGSKNSLQTHHIIPRYLGGKNVLENLELLCKKCHKKVHNQLKKIYLRKKTKLKGLIELSKKWKLDEESS